MKRIAIAALAAVLVPFGAYAADEDTPVQPEVVETEGAQNGAQAAGVWQKTKESTGEAWGATRKGASEAADYTSEKAGQAWKATRDGTGKAVDWTKEKSEQAWEATKQTAGKAGDAVKQGYEKTKEKTREIVGSE